METFTNKKDHISPTNISNLETFKYGVYKPSCLGFNGKELLPRTYSGIPGSILRRNNDWPMLRMSRINHPPLVDQKPVREKKKWCI
jgi:hypothetical protein